jgi:hypothetical protein
MRAHENSFLLDRALLRIGRNTAERIWRITSKGQLLQRHSPPIVQIHRHHACGSETGMSRTHRLPVVAGTRHALLIQAGRSAVMAVSASGAGPDADTCSRQSAAVSAARPRWRAKNRAELSRSYSVTG